MENETRFSQKYQCESRESHESRRKGKIRYVVKLASLAICESCNLRDLQFARLANKQNHNSLEKLVLDPKFSQESRVEFSNDSRKSHYEICLRASREASLATKFLSVRLKRSDSHYEIS